MKSLNILNIVRSPAGGIRRHLMALIEGQLKSGHRVYLICDCEDSDSSFKSQIEVLKKRGLNLLDLKIESGPSIKDIANLLQIYSLYKSQKIDIVHGHGAKGGLYARLLRSPLGARAIYTPHGGSLHSMFGGVKNRMYNFIERRLARYTDFYLVESRYSERKVLELGVAPSHVKLNPNGVQVSGKGSGLEYKPTDVFRISAFGLLRSIKGFDVLIGAISLLPKSLGQVQLNVYGRGEELEFLEKMVTDLDILDKVKFCGEIAEVESEMLQSHLIVQPSYFESFGFVCAEALSLGVPVIGSNVGGICEVVENARYGLLFEVGDAKELAEKIVWAMQNYSEMKRMAMLGREYISNNYSESRMVETVLNVYSDVLTSGVKQ